MVIFDDGNTILKTLTFDQPTDWLARQLARDLNLWNRQWVINQLATRKDDAAAGSALATTATGADYYLTRAQAATALGAFPESVALAPLTRALADTSAAVREAALHGLGTLGGDSALALARKAFDADRSYEVRAAAVEVLGHAPGAERQAILTRALATSSYQDAIGNAALRVIAQSNDTALVGLVNAQVGRLSEAVWVLAALGRGGDQRAYDLLASHLGDARQVVRRRRGAGPRVRGAEGCGAGGGECRAAGNHPAGGAGRSSRHFGSGSPRGRTSPRTPATSGKVSRGATPPLPSRPRRPGRDWGGGAPSRPRRGPTAGGWRRRWSRWWHRAAPAPRARRPRSGIRSVLEGLESEENVIDGAEPVGADDHRPGVEQVGEIEGVILPGEGREQPADELDQHLVGAGRKRTDPIGQLAHVDPDAVDVCRHRRPDGRPKPDQRRPRFHLSGGPGQQDAVLVIAGLPHGARLHRLDSDNALARRHQRPGQGGR